LDPSLPITYLPRNLLAPIIIALDSSAPSPSCALTISGSQ
jgi:hypothetical protein